MTRCCAIVELRQYIMRKGRRDEMVALFEREFVESQEALGSTVIGTFRDLDRPDRFVWLRGFESPEARFQALDGFYTSDHWKALRNAANATIVDNDDVLQLKPAAPHAGFDLPPDRAPVGTEGVRRGLFVANLWSLANADEAGFANRFEKALAPLLAQHGAAPIAWFVIDQRPNDYPRLPVREGQHMLVWFASFDGPDSHADATAALEAAPEWRAAWDRVGAAVASVQVLRLEPTARSRLHG